MSSRIDRAVLSRQPQSHVRGQQNLAEETGSHILPPQFDRHRKQGFSIPLGSWLQQASWWRFFRDVLLGSKSGLFNREALARVLNGQARGRANSERLFALVMLELWRREYQL